MIAVASLRAAVLDAPDDWDLRRVFADALEEEGDAVRANGQRWQARDHRRPRKARSMRRSGGRSYDWWEHPTYIEYADSWLAPVIFRRLSGGTMTGCEKCCEYPDCEAAEAALARALWDLGVRVRGDE